MKYFIIRQSSDANVIGVKNGASQAKIIQDSFVDPGNYDRFMDYFLSNDPEKYYLHVGTFPDFDIKLEYILLQQDAKLTDFISYFPNLHHGGNFLVRDKILEILKDYKLPPFKIYDVNLTNGRDHFPEYKLLYCPPLGYDVIDFGGTTFFTGNDILGKAFFKLESGSSYEQHKVKSKFRTEKISFKTGKDFGYDYFLSRISTPHVFISERLKERFEKERVSGVNIVEAHEPLIELI